jgi:alpha-amylase
VKTKSVPRSFLAVFATLAITACSAGDQQARTPTGAFVQLFEWRWPDIATECEDFLGPAGYTAVQVSPPNEHITGPAWWTRYQPVSYKIESRGGTRAEFADMVGRCKDAGVDIYADAIVNHMAGFASGSGVAGSDYSEFSYPVPYEFDDFHHCGRYDDDRIRNYQDLWEIQNCQLGTLDDLDTGKPSVQRKIAAYLNDLLSLGVAGFRLDAVKHVSNDEVAEILQQVEGDPFVFQEVIDPGSEPIDATNYIQNGMVTEFKYPPVIVDAFENGNLDALTDFSSQPGWLPADQAIVFVDNHDLQRGHAGGTVIVNYKDGARYDLAVAFMLAYPYGYPLVMSSYEFEDHEQGPPDSSPHDDTKGCGNEWVCEHRRNAIASMVGFRKAVGDAELVNWQIVEGTTLSFGRGDKGHIVINMGEQAVRLELQTGMPAGEYHDLISGSSVLSVDADGLIDVSLEPLSTMAIAIAIQSGG